MRSLRLIPPNPKRLITGLTILLGLIVGTVQTASAATFTVNSTTDAVDTNPGDGVCATSAGECTLRAAIQEANAAAGADTISLPAGAYLIALTTGADDFAFGDFDIAGPLTINGAGAATTVLDATAIERVLEIHPTAGNVTLTGLTLQNGYSAEDGGGIYNTSAGTLRLENIALRNNASEIEGGGLYNAVGRVNIIGTAGAPVMITDNQARGGGGLYNAGGLSEVGLPARIDLTYVTVSENSAASGGGVASDHEGVLNVIDSTITDNLAEDHGGGLSAGSRAAVSLTRVNITGNRAVGEGGGLFVAAERALTIVDSLFADNEAGTSIPSEVPGQTITGDGGGGGLAVASSGPTTISGSTFERNSAVGDGGAILIESLGSVSISDTIVRNNQSESNAGGIENSGNTVTFERLTIHNNTAGLDGGGIENQGSGAFTIVDTNIYSNIAENGGGFANAGDGVLSIRNTTFWDNRAIVGLSDDTGLGGGIYSLGDAGTEYENVTISANLAQVRGGGLYIDADAGVRVINTTIAFNSAPVASGVGGEIGSVNFPVYPSTSVIFRNTIVAANEGGPACSFALGSEGGNIEDGDSCYFRGPRDRTFAPIIGLDAVADNGGQTLTMALQPDSYAIDGGVNPCVETDQRGVARPQNGQCDSGAFEYEGPFPPPDTTPPDTEYLSGPVQNTENTSLFTFTGSDNVTAAEDLLFECRLIESDPTEPPEPPDPTQPPAPELAFISCPNPWQVTIIEDGTWTFEVRAIDRAGNVDPTPVSHTFTVALDLIPPDTFFLETPPDPSFSNTATFSFGGTDNATPAQFIGSECRIDSNDPAAWLECTNPAVYSNLTTGSHTVQVRAADGSDNIDPTPATFTWTVAPPANCEAANITLFAAEDSYVDEALPLDNFGFGEALLVTSAAPGADARSLLRFVLPSGLPADCELERATLRLYADGEAGRTLQAIPIDAAWSENQVTWLNQPAATGTPATAASGSAYREWNVTAATVAMLSSGVNYGWLIRDAAEEDAAGASQSFLSSEAVREPPTPPQLVLRFEDSGDPPPATPPAPSAATVTCGQVIMESIVLQNDLLGCPGEGLVVGASNLIIDLNGHTISSGLAIEPGEEDGLVAGIRNSGHSNVIVRNGAIRNFGYGVRLLAGARYNVVENMTLINNINAGLELFDADDGRNGNLIHHNVFQLNGTGVQITSGSENSVVESNSFTGNVGVAIYMYDSSGHRIANNTVTGETGNPLLDSDGGIYLESASDNEIIGNSLSDTGDAAILLTAGSHRNRIENNTTTRASDSAISLDDSDENEVVNNVLHLAGGAGIGLGNANDSLISGNDVRFNPGGIELAGSSGNRIENNDASYTGASGITVEGGEDNEIVNNVANNTGASGISVEAETLDANGNPIGGFLIENNQANGNLGDGISVGGAGHTIANNTAYNNLAFGISAAEGNIDGGGNFAAGNAEPVQCVGVICTAGPGAPPSAADITPPDTAILTQPASGSSTLEAATFTFYRQRQPGPGHGAAL